MFTITIAKHLNHTEQTIYTTRNNQGFYNLKINEKVNDYGSMTFSCIPAEASSFDINDIITVYQDGSPYWQGIIITKSRGFYGDVNVTAYGMLFTLTYQILNPNYWTATTIGNITNWIKTQNNRDAGSGLSINTDYEFAISFDGSAASDPIYDYSVDFTNSLDAFKNLLEPYSCFIYPTYYAAFQNPCFTVNVGEYDVANRIVNQPIEFGLNLLDYTDEQTMANYITSVAPIGKDASGNPVYITSVSQDGSGYVKASNAVIAEYGEKRTRVNFDNLSDPNDLLAAGTEWLSKNAFQELTITLSAVDLSSLTSLGYDEFKLGYFVNVNASQFGFSAQLPVLERTVDLTDPANSTLTLTNTYQLTLSEMVRGNSK